VTTGEALSGYVLVWDEGDVFEDGLWHEIRDTSGCWAVSWCDAGIETINLSLTGDDGNFLVDMEFGSLSDAQEFASSITNLIAQLGRIDNVKSLGALFK